MDKRKFIAFLVRLVGIWVIPVFIFAFIGDYGLPLFIKIDEEVFAELWSVCVVLVAAVWLIICFWKRWIYP